MNHAQVDYLLQLPVPRSEPAPLASRSRDDAPPFDDHFRQASDASAATTSSPATPTQSSAADREDDDRQSSTNSAPPAISETSADDASETDEERDSDDVELPETAEAAAVLAAAEQVTQVIVSEAVVDAENTVPELDHPDGVCAQSAAEAHGDPTSAADATPSASEANVDAKAAAAAQLEQSDTAEHDLTAATVEYSSEESTESQQAPPQKDGTSPHVNAKSLSGEHWSNDKPVDGDAIEQQAVAQTAAAVHSGDPTPDSNTEDRKSTVNGTPKKSDKKLTMRAEAALRDAATPQNERTAASARSTDAPAVASTVANVQAQLRSGDTTPSASVDSTTKSKDATAGVKEGLLSPFARLERNGASGAAGSRRAGRGEGAPHVDPARFVSRVARAIQTAEERGGPLQLRLSPPELGAMRLEISVNQGALTATIETDNSNARQLLLDNLPALRDRLAEQNVKIERFDVDVRRDTSGNGQPNFGPQEHGQHERHNPLSDRHGAARRAAVPQVAAETSPIHRAITNTSINVVA